VKKVIALGFLIGCLLSVAIIATTNRVAGDEGKAPPCDCTCTGITLDSATYAAGNLAGSVTYTTNKACGVNIILVAAPYYFNGTDSWTGSQVLVGSGSGQPLTITGSAPVPGNFVVGWYVQAYIVRTCDNTIIGWSNERFVSRY